MFKSTLAAGLIGGVAAAVFATPSLAAEVPPDVFTVVSHEDEVFLFPADPACGAPVGSMEVQQGTEWHHAVGSEGGFHVVDEACVILVEEVELPVDELGEPRSAASADHRSSS